MKDFLTRFEELAKYPDVALAVAIVLALGLAVILNLYGKALKEQISTLEKQKLGLEADNTRLKGELTKVSEYRDSFEKKLEQLQQAQIELAAYSDFEDKLENIQSHINLQIELILQENHDTKVLRELQKERASLQDLSYRYKKFQEGLPETVKAAENLSTHKDLWIDTAVNNYLANRRRKAKWWTRMLPSILRRR